MSVVGLNSETRYATARQFCIKRNLYLINYNRMRAQWTAKENRDAGSSCLSNQGLHRYLRNFGGEGLNTPTPPSVRHCSGGDCVFERKRLNLAHGGCGAIVKHLKCTPLEVLKIVFRRWCKSDIWKYEAYLASVVKASFLLVRWEAELKISTWGFSSGRDAANQTLDVVCQLQECRSRRGVGISKRNLVSPLPAGCLCLVLF